MLLFKVVAITTLMAFAFDQVAYAWNKAGHMVTGAIAYSVLKEESPATIDKGFEMNVAKLTGNISKSERAVALCWIAHLIGDVHQPLHTTSLFTTKFQKENGRLVGDRGGTRFYVRATEGSDPIHLHKYWDGSVIGSEKFKEVRDRAILLRAKPEHAKAHLTELSSTDFDDWAFEESYALAQKTAYRNGDLKGSPTKSSAPVLPHDYADTIKPIAERRVVLAGFRLANLLRKELE